MRRLDTEIAYLQRQIAPAPAPRLTPPAKRTLPVPAPPRDVPAPELKVDEERARKAIREDFAIRRLAAPDRAEEEYFRELGRLRRRFLEQRPEAFSADLEAEIRRAREMAAGIARLERQVQLLQEQPVDRFLYPDAERQQRRIRLRQLLLQLEELREKNRERLREALETPVAPSVDIPPTELERAEREREELRREGASALRELEQQELARVDTMSLPPPRTGGAEAPVRVGAESGVPRDPLAGAVAEAESVPPPPARTEALSKSALPGLKSRRADLQRRILEDLQVAARAAGHSAGVRVTFDPGRAPDRTAELLPTVRALLHPGAVRSGSR